MATPQATRRHYNDLARMLVQVRRSAARTWRRMPAHANWERHWPVLAPLLVAAVSAAQRESASSTPGYVSTVLTEIGLAESTEAAAGHVNPASLMGVASDGRDLGSLLYGAVVHSGEQFNAGLSPAAALSQGQKWLMETIETQVMDAARVGAEVEMAAQSPQSVSGYVRMVEPGACSRCIVLAGKFYRWNSGFLRHPGCRCVHIPATENVEHDWRTNPNDYFESLSREEQDRIFGKSGAEAIRLGADISQVVNARRGMRTTVLHRHRALITTEGTTRRGFYGGGHGGSKPGGYTGRNVGRRGAVANYTERRAKRVRLMPETILTEARDREDAVRLLKLYGFLTP